MTTFHGRGSHKITGRATAWLAVTNFNPCHASMMILPIVKQVILSELPKLRGMNLCCFCALDQPCHADVLLELANTPNTEPTP